MKEKKIKERVWGQTKVRHARFKNQPLKMSMSRTECKDISCV